MPKRLPNEELFEDGDRTIRFVADFGFSKSVCLMGRDITLIFSDLASGLLPVEDIANIIICAVVDIDGDEVKEAEKQALAEGLIALYGLQQCHQLAWILLSHIMIGEKKSSEIDVQQRREMMLKNLIPGQSTNSKKVGLLWAAVWLSSTLAACMSFSFYSLLTA